MLSTRWLRDRTSVARLGWIASLMIGLGRRETVDVLRSQCEKCIECLKDLMVLHLGIDSQGKDIEPTDIECVFRLRKVLLHVRAITGCQLETNTLHVIAPEIRCANEQLQKIFKRKPQVLRANYLGDENNSLVEQIRRNGKTIREIVSPFVHPTFQRLLLPVEHGGLDKPKEVACFFNIFGLLMDLSWNYGVSVAHLADKWKIGTAADSRLILQRVTSAAATIGALSMDEILEEGR